MATDPLPKSTRDRHDTAANLREQAASCRRLAADARTQIGRTSLTTLADQFDAQALTLDPSSDKQ